MFDEPSEPDAPKTGEDWRDPKVRRLFAMVAGAVLVASTVLALGAVKAKSYLSHRPDKVQTVATAEAPKPFVYPTEFERDDIHGYITGPGIVYTNGSDAFVDYDVASEAIEANLTAANLRTWQLCEAELSAWADALSTQANARKTMPNDMPHNYEPDFGPKSEYAHLRASAIAFRQAAALSKAAGIGCVNPYANETYVSNVRLDVTEPYDDMPHIIIVPSIRVIGIPTVEEMRVMNQCTSSFEEDYRRYSTREVAARVTQHPKRPIFSQWRKIDLVSTYQASMSLAKSQRDLLGCPA